MTVRRDAIARDLCRRISDGRRSEDELRVVSVVLEGLERGADVYGPLDLATDPRDWRREEAEEYRDAIIYRACALLSERDDSAPRTDSSSARVGNPGVGNGAGVGTLSAPAGSAPPAQSPTAGGGTFCQRGEMESRPGPNGEIAGSSPVADTAPAHPSNGSQRVGGGTCSKCGGGLPCWLAECPVRDAGLRELAAAKPQVAAPGVADDHTLWSSEMVDGRFDDSEGDAK